MSVKILPYRLGSNTAKALADAFGTIRIHHDPTKSKFRGGTKHVVYNYGNASVADWMADIPSNLLLNHPTCVTIASNKVRAFQALQAAIDSDEYSNLSIPEWTVSKPVAEGWIKDGGVVYCRQLTRASQGRGIVVAHTADQLVNAPLYTKGVASIKREYRAHVFDGEVIDLVAKAAQNGQGEDVNQEIKSHDNGWIFVRDAVAIPDAAKEKLVNTAIETVEALGLDVAAVDIIRDDSNNLFVLEVNTAPGMEGTTLNKYVTALKEYYDTQIDKASTKYSAAGKKVFKTLKFGDDIYGM